MTTGHRHTYKQQPTQERRRGERKKKKKQQTEAEADTADKEDKADKAVRSFSNEAPAGARGHGKRRDGSGGDVAG